MGSIVRGCIAQVAERSMPGQGSEQGYWVPAALQNKHRQYPGNTLELGQLSSHSHGVVLPADSK
jgi:hypothetical protein